MADKIIYDAIIVQTPDDFKRMTGHHERMCRLLPADRVFFVGRSEIADLLANERENYPEDSAIKKAGFINENDILPFDAVHEIVCEIVKRDMGGQVPGRNITGWYYQQFIKWAYSNISDNKYYLVWDGDTIPCREFSMFSDDDHPFFDTKHEYHKPYFDTISKILPELSKCIDRSFISEHMIMDCDLVKELTSRIEANEGINGSSFWEKVLWSLSASELMDSGFSEFETYGTYVMSHHKDAYILRSYNSMRYGAMFFDKDKISDRDFDWLSKDFYAISFEKNQAIRPDTNNIFNNPRYQEKLSARQIMEMVQEDYKNDEYREVWD
ncbi:DUF6492 family protein [Butyrivibrio sp. TB]|uniref:DUF6492 family protein n=1 Tax=Butyrivibrio sp. TB TaxID=1520809 RepID=UPI0008B841E0|nr:DUF6492 family protein [Butyrivibrio sp. TB]SEQ15658.1 hypothetical protein SAMN02910382_02192 [Butyrivibrio sp. TB]